MPFSDKLKKQAYQKAYHKLWYLKNKEKKDRQNKEYATSHPEQEKERSKKWRAKNRDKELARLRLRQITHKAEISAKFKQRYLNNKDAILKKHREFHAKHSGRINIMHVRSYHKNLESWEPHIGKEFRCEICGRDIYFNKHFKKTAVHFDHHSYSVPIKGCPTTFLGKHPCTPENIKIWDACKFGKLCLVCNRRLSTNNRPALLRYLLRNSHV